MPAIATLRRDGGLCFPEISFVRLIVAHWRASADAVHTFAGHSCAQRSGGGLSLRNIFSTSFKIARTGFGGRCPPVLYDHKKIRFSVFCFAAQVLSEVVRVLKPGGYLLLVDFRNSVVNLELFRQELKDSGMDVVSEENISANVVADIESEDESKRGKLNRLSLPGIRNYFLILRALLGQGYIYPSKMGPDHTVVMF